MRPLVVIFDPEVFDDDAGFSERPELFAVEAFIPEPTMERFDKTILPGTSWLDLDGHDLVFGKLALQRLRDELGPIVGTNELRGPMLDDGCLHEFDHVARLEGPVGPQDVTLAGMFVEDRQHPERSTAHRGIGNEVPRPDMLFPCRFGGQSLRVAATSIPPRCGKNPQAFLPPQPTDLAQADLPAFRFQLGQDAAMVIPRVLVTEHMEPLHQLLLAARTLTGLIPVTGSRQPEDPTSSSPRAHPIPDGCG